MRDLIFSYYDSPFERHGRLVSAPWTEWIELFSSHDVRGSVADTADKAVLDHEKMGPAILLGEVPDGKTRAKAHVRQINALALDLDSATLSQVSSVVQALSQFEYFAWTTHKHGSVVAGPCPRLRFVLPLLTPIAPADYPSAWAGFNRLVGGFNDPATKDCSRLHFLPSTFDPALAETMHNEGRWITLEDLPDVELVPSVSALDSQEAVDSIRRKMKRVPADSESKPLFQSITNGESFAESGERHDAVIQATMWIASRDPALSRSALDSLFSSSLATMSQDAQDAPTSDEVWTAYQGAVEKLAEHRRQKEQEAQLSQTDSKLPYNDSDYKRIADVNGWAVDELRDKWVVQRDGAAWFLSATGEYEGPYGREDMPMAIARYLSRTDARLVDLTKTGFRYRPTSDVVRENGSLASAIVSDLTIQRTAFEPHTRILHEAVRPLRAELTPAFDESFDEWLRLAGGDHYEKLVDWLACAPDLNKILCAVYFHGQKSSGKTLFAYGLSKLWTEGPPADIEAAISDFNEELARCPIVLADEQIPRRPNSTVTATLRSLLSTTSRTLKRKYRPPSEIKGAIRLVLAANNEFLLNSNDVSSSQDLEAIAERFLYIDIAPEASDYLDSLHRDKKEQLAQEGIARHALWLRDNHEIVNPGKRFWVEGDVSEMHRLLMTGSYWNSLVCEWLVKYLLAPNAFDSRSTGLVRRMKGELLVNDQALVDHWDAYIRSREEPHTVKIGAALRAIAKTTRRRQLRFDGRQIRYRSIDVDHLIAWADRYNIGDTQSILSAVDPEVDNAKVVYTTPVYGTQHKES